MNIIGINKNLEINDGISSINCSSNCSSSESSASSNSNSMTSLNLINEVSITTSPPTDTKNLNKLKGIKFYLKNSLIIYNSNLESSQLSIPNRNPIFKSPGIKIYLSALFN